MTTRRPTPPPPDTWDRLTAEIVTCERCPRLTAWCRQVAREKRAAYRDWDYWGRPVPPFGDPAASILVVGLAPAAHGANRTGRYFTGDRSGDWLYRAMHKAGLANQPTSRHKDDGLALSGTFISAMVRCAPPENKPTPEERDACRPFFHRELALLPHVRVIVALGKFAWDGVVETLAHFGHSLKPKPIFGHLATATIGPYVLIGSYHPSQQNTFTGKLTEPMFDAVFAQAVAATRRGT
jgi:uracil-DNA glycosylase family 4